MVPEKFLNYKLQILTRTGHVSFILVTDQANLEKDKATLRSSILKNFVVKEGHQSYSAKRTKRLTTNRMRIDRPRK
ncbi:DUF2167 domain-containing protein [uncultured Brevibacillus sp.]|uniref:DUF2167 domain-containing protein n=1 Tax=uncultured Brevibacillus sp. TaxID=169970 RepID=UPI002594B2C8|nr:DUF2167 domain-containing protein [uncultured Brevibacillus sp.]